MANDVGFGCWVHSLIVERPTLNKQRYSPDSVSDTSCAYRLRCRYGSTCNCCVTGISLEILAELTNSLSIERTARL